MRRLKACRLSFVIPPVTSLFTCRGISVWQRGQQHDLSDIKLIMSRRSKTSYNIPLFSHGWDYCLMKIQGEGIGGGLPQFTVKESQYVAIWCLSHPYSWGAPFTPNPHGQWQTSAEAKHDSRVALNTNRSLRETLPIPPSKSPLPSPTLIFKSALQWR